MLENSEVEASYVVERRDDRRQRGRFDPPYVTNEGLVLIDRRDGGERRSARDPIVEPLSDDQWHLEQAIVVHEVERVEIELQSL